MSKRYDLVIRGGTVVDGSGAEGYIADVAVSAGKIVQVGKISGRGAEELNAGNLLVTPGFVDIHTHYDGQVTWDTSTEPSSSHGVTTVVMGNCGVGFAPCRPADRPRLIALMEGVEDVPEAVIVDGLPWNWETFPQYLDAIDRPRDLDIAAMLPHACARVYVMGDRAVDHEVATAEDLLKMRRLAEEAMRAGAVGFGTSRGISHRDSKGQQIPTAHAAEAELQAFADGMKDAGHGVIEALFDFGDMDNEVPMLRRIGKKSGRPISFTLMQSLAFPDAWKRGLPLLQAAKDEGLRLKGQVIGRPTGLLMGLDLSYSPFSLRPTYINLAKLPLGKKLAELRKPEIRAKILGETDISPPYNVLRFLKNLDRIFILGDPPDYIQPLDQSIAAIAARKGIAAEVHAYDLLLENDGTNILMLALANYVDGTLGPVSAMLNDENTILGLGDGGAHYGMLCDAGCTTFMLTYWGRDVAPEKRMSIATLVKKLTADTAAAVDLLDRGYVKAGYKADLNLIDFKNLRLHAPHAEYDLPANGRRVKQRADGYVATIVNGEVTYRNGVRTGSLPGKLVRGPQAWPEAMRSAAQ
jgi:N-acyl-D-amino-acid deacylase